VGEPARFAVEHWGRAPLHRPGADAAAYADLFSLADVDSLISSASLRTPAFRLVRDGRPLPEGSYTKSGRIGSRAVSDLADPGLVFEQFRGGATIVLQSVHRYWAPLTRFCRELELALTHPVQVNIYVTPPASRGLGVHHDGHDVFVLQVHGRKRWDVFDVGDDDGAGERRVEAELEPGDALYLPKAFPHAARTTETASVHLTIGVLATSWREVLRQAVDEALADPAFSEPLPVGFAEEPSALSAAVAAQLGDLAGRLEKQDAQALSRDAAERFWSSRPPILTGQLQQLLALDAIDDTTPMRVRPGSVCRLSRAGDRLAVVLGDRRLSMPAWVEPAVRAMLDRGTFRVGELAEHLDQRSRLVLVRRLVREGLLLA
jgi:uncharacterized RmlC-like cupin family protein